MIEVIFVKGAAKIDTLTIKKMQNVQTLANPKQGIIPHDMVHFAVEKVYGTHGFIWLVANGQSPAFVMDNSGVEAWHEEGLVEAFQAELWSGATTDEYFLEMVNKISDQRNIPHLTLKSEEIAAGRTLLRELSQKWQNLAIGNSMELELAD